MVIVCLQCALQGFIDANGELKTGDVNFVQSYGIVDGETREEHDARVHPDGVATAIERQELECQAGAIIRKQKDSAGTKVLIADLTKTITTVQQKMVTNVDSIDKDALAEAITLNAPDD